jgi:hypothetical protein
LIEPYRISTGQDAFGRDAGSLPLAWQNRALRFAKICDKKHSSLTELSSDLSAVLGHAAIVLRCYRDMDLSVHPFVAIVLRLFRGEKQNVS